MKKELRFERIDAMATVAAVNATLRRIDERLIDHGERVAYIACQLAQAGGLELELKTLFLLCIFHDIGAYKTDEIDRMVEFETRDVMNHSIYGYLFLKHLTPLRSHAQAVLYHHTPWSELRETRADCVDYASLIHLADRIDIASQFDPGGLLLDKLFKNPGGQLREEYLDIVRRCCADGYLAGQLESGAYRAKNIELCSGFLPSVAESLEFIKMIVYSIDFRSEYTVTHTINTVSLADNIARRFGLDEPEREKIYLGSLLHDVGKISIPLSILESAGRLSDEQMAVMRSHVTETEALIRGVVPEDICQIAVRHHEKLDGSGYPHGLRAEELSFPQRIVAVADIVSALCSRRSYKEPFPRDRVIGILRSMRSHQLDPGVCDYVCENYDDILRDTEPARDDVIRRYQSIMEEYGQLARRHRAVSV